jgi:hypothetical protein
MSPNTRYLRLHAHTTRLYFVITRRRAQARETHVEAYLPLGDPSCACGVASGSYQEASGREERVRQGGAVRRLLLAERAAWVAGLQRTW